MKVILMFTRHNQSTFHSRRRLKRMLNEDVCPIIQTDFHWIKQLSNYQTGSRSGFTGLKD